MPAESTPVPPTIRLHPDDDVVVARVDLEPGLELPGEGVAVRGRVPRGHKVATRDVAAGAPVRRYGQTIGFASQVIAPGDHVHTHNLAMGEPGRAYEFSTLARPTAFVDAPATFQGIRREDGRVATRNYVGILTSVNCSATVATRIADAFRRRPGSPDDPLAEYPNVDGVVALTHKGGCALPGEGEAIDLLRRTLGGYARHPNFAAVVVVGLGCETNQIGPIVDTQGLRLGPKLHALTIQEEGGTIRTVERGVALVKALLPDANRSSRQPVPLSHLVVGLQCGGSDGYSGITANPALGAASDLVVRHGGTVILSETPETYGAEHLLTRRAVSREVGEKLLRVFDWWKDYTARNGAVLDNNPSFGNKAGGLTTILEKSLGAVAKAGTTNLVDVYRYAEAVRERGFVFMDTPGYDPVSATGQVAGGANLVCFTTGRGSVFGCVPSPSIKLSTNTALYRRMGDDIDLDCGGIADGLETVEACGRRIFDRIVRVASGEESRSEALGFGEAEFAPWTIGATM